MNNVQIKELHVQGNQSSVRSMTSTPESCDMRRRLELLSLIMRASSSLSSSFSSVMVVDRSRFSFLTLTSFNPALRRASSCRKSSVLSVAGSHSSRGTGDGLRGTMPSTWRSSVPGVSRVSHLIVRRNNSLCERYLNVNSAKARLPSLEVKSRQRVEAT